jgi:hypothetical protein
MALQFSLSKEVWCSLASDITSGADAVNRSQNLRRWVGFVAPVVVALIASFFFVVNDTDTRAIRNGSLQILTNSAPYTLENNKSPFTSPPHVALLGLPFVVAGARWSAFWNVFFALPVVIGNRNGLATLAAKLMLIFTPPFLYMLASANITGTVTGIGLLLLLANATGPSRGLAWAFLLLRPQDGWLFLLYDGFRALRTRDLTAFLSCGVIVIIPVLFTPTVFERWFTAMYFPLFIDSLRGYTLSLSGTHGFGITLAFLLGIGVLRSFKVVDRRVVWRQKGDFSQAELFWLMAVITLVAGFYTAYYMIWLAFIIVRNYGLIRTALILFITMGVGAMYMTLPQPEQVQTGMLILIVVLAVLSPRERSEALEDAKQSAVGSA